MAYGPLLADAHVVFFIDINSDVSVINRLRSREHRVGSLLRALCDTARKYNFSFSAVHHSGEKNELMDWASRPDLHLFRGSPSAFKYSSSRPDPGMCSDSGGGEMASGSFPPLPSPVSLTYINSRCLRFGAVDPSASWTSTSCGW